MGDECSSNFTYDPQKPYSIASAAGSKENVIIIGSVSKTFAMTGWRIGYTLGPEALIQALIKLQSQSTSNATSIAQYAALEAMRGTMETVPVMLAEYAKRRKRIVEGLRAIPGVTCEWPGGAFYAFPNISAHTSGASGRPALAKSCTEMPADWRGDDLWKPSDFPLLVKFIFPTDNLSIQVHPDDAYAAVHEHAAGGRGKTEMWHVVYAEPGARLLLGLKPGVTKEAF